MPSSCLSDQTLVFMTFSNVALSLLGITMKGLISPLSCISSLSLMPNLMAFHPYGLLRMCLRPPTGACSATGERAPSKHRGTPRLDHPA